MKFKDVVAFMNVSLSSGLVKGERLMDFFQRNFEDRPLEDFPMPFAAVATSLHTGAEVWLRHGSKLDAVRASIAVPGLFTPALHGGKVLVDGRLVNPVPVSLARGMGADIVIAVDLSSGILGRQLRPHPPAPAPTGGEIGEWIRKLQGNLGALIPSHSLDEPRMPSLFEVMTSSINMADEASRPHRGSTAGSLWPARLSPCQGGDQGRQTRSRASRAQSSGAHESNIMTEVALDETLLRQAA